MKRLMKLFKKKSELEDKKKLAKQTEEKHKETVYLTETVTFGMHPYRSADEDSSVFFVDEKNGVRKMIIDSRGNIQNFPGMIKEDFWVKHVAPNYLKPRVGFRSSFEKRENGWIFLWQLQPDGWYWADEDGFGGEDDLEVVLYTYLNLSGDFTGPFRIYQLGNRGYAIERFRGNHDHAQKQAMQAALGDENPGAYPSDILPQLWGSEVRHVQDRFYQLRDRKEAMEYWEDPVLSKDLKELAQALLDSPKSLWEMMGRASGRVKSCMTLFYLITEEPVFKQVLDKFCNGNLDEYTVRRLQEEGQ